MAPPDLRRPFKRAAISDQQKRRDISLQRQAQNRRDAQHQARLLALTTLSLQNDSAAAQPEPEPEFEHSEPDFEIEPESEVKAKDFDVRQAASLRGLEARRWFAKQLMLPEWMIDVPDRLNTDWYLLLSYLHLLNWFNLTSIRLFIFWLYGILNSSPSYLSISLSFA